MTTTQPEKSAAGSIFSNEVAFDSITEEIRAEARAALAQSTREMIEAKERRDYAIGFSLARRVLTNAEVMNITGLSRQRCYQLKREFVENTARPAGTDAKPLF